MPSRLEERDTSGLRPSLLLSSNNAAAGPSRRSAGTRIPLYGLPGVTTSTHSLPPRGRATPPIASSSAAPMAVESDLGSGFVRSTLTAPDNMLRRQALEREKERKAKRIVKKQERARQAMEALATEGGAGPSSSTTAMRSGQRTGMSPAPVPASSSSRPRTPVETNQQTSASPRRSPSPRRRARPAARTAEPVAEVTVPSVVPTASQQPRAAESQSIPVEPSSMPGSFPEASTTHPNQPAAVRARRQGRVRPPVTTTTTSAATDRNRMAHRASLRRHNIYQEIAHMGLPGVESASESSEVEQQGQDASSLFSSDLGRAAAPPISEDPPPPFPEGGARPPSPPRAPPIRVDGQEYDWTSEDERTWADYRRRVPDSPPPAFESEDENTRNAGRPRPEEGDDASSTASSNENQTATAPSPEQLAWEDDVRRGLSLEDRIARLEARRRRLEGPQEQLESRTASIEPPAELPASTALSEAQPEARSSLHTIIAPAAQPTVAQGSKPVVPTTPAPMIVLPPGAGLNTDGALSHPSLPHQTSASRVARTSAATTGPTRRRRRTEPRNTAEHTLAPPCTAAVRGGATAIRPRPSSESHSRFRDDAAAAAERRRLAWGAAAGPLEVPKASAWRTERQPPMSSTEVRPTSAPTAMPGSFAQEQDAAEVAMGETQNDSDDSAEEWAAEAAAFEALRQAAEKTPAVVDSDAEEGSDVDEDMPGGLAVYRSPMGRLQDTLPKAPPPLALGRSRNAGLAYDASDSDDSPDEGRSAFESGSEDSLTDEDQVVRHHNPRWQTPEDDGIDAASTPSGSTLVRTSSSKSMPSRTQVISDTARLSSPSTSSLSAADKGKQASRGSTLRSTQASRSTSRVRSSTSPTVAKSSQAQSIREAGPSGSRPAEPAQAPAIKPLPVPGTTAHQVNAASTSPVLPSAPSLRRQSSSSSIWQSSLPGAPGRETHAEVTDRLKGLFGASLANSSSIQGQGVDPASREPIASQQAPLRRKSSSRSTAEPKSVKPSETESSVASQPPSAVNTAARGLPDDQQLRRDALSDIAKLSRQASGSERSSLAALERMLTDSLRIDSAGSSQPLISSSTTARRQPPPIPPRNAQPVPTAVSNLTRSGSVYINPRSSFAPLPRQTRLPAITDDTRHFPRTRASTLLTGEESRDAPALPPRPPVGLRIAGLMAKFEQSAGQANRDDSVQSDAQDSQQQSIEAAQNSAAAGGPLINVGEPASSTGEAASAQDYMPAPSTAQQDVAPAPKRRPPPPPPARPSAPVESLPEDLPLRPFSVAAASSAGVATSLPASSSLDSGLSTRSNQSSNLPGGLFRTNSQADRARRAAWAALTRNAAVPVEGQETQSDRPSSGEEVIADAVRRVGTLRARPPPPLPESIRRAGVLAEVSETAPSDQGVRPAQEAIQSIRPATRTIDDGPSSGASEATRFGRRLRPLPMPPSSSASPVPVATLIESARREQAIVDTPAAVATSNEDSTASTVQAPATQPARSASLGFTDLDLLASRLEEDPSNGYDTAILLSSFLGPANPHSVSLTPSELASIPLGTIYIEKRRTTKEGKVKTKLACLGLRVDRCGICLTQFKEGQGAYVLGCLHVFHGRIDSSGNGPDCAREWFRNSRRCPTCRAEALGRGEEVNAPSGALIEL